MNAAAPDLSARFALLIAGLCRVVAAYIARDRDAGLWILLVWSRLRRIANRVERLSAQVRAGTVPPLRAGYKLTRPRKPATRPPIVLAGKPAWLIVAIPQAAAYGEYLRQILHDPEMAALLSAAPQLARILRPLCRALGVAAPLPPRLALPAPAPAEPPAASAARPAAESGPASRPGPARALAVPARCGPDLKPA